MFPFSKYQTHTATNSRYLILTNVPARPPILTSLSDYSTQERYVPTTEHIHDTNLTSAHQDPSSDTHTYVIHPAGSPLIPRPDSPLSLSMHNSPQTSQPQTSSAAINSHDSVSTQHHRVTTNQHQMVTRAKSGIFKPKNFLAHSEPKTIAEALEDTNWRQAMLDEFQALQQNNTWTLVPLPPHRHAIGCKWLFKVKQNADGSIERYKARLVAKDFN